MKVNSEKIEKRLDEIHKMQNDYRYSTIYKYELKKEFNILEYYLANLDEAEEKYKEYSDLLFDEVVLEHFTIEQIKEMELELTILEDYFFGGNE